MADIGYNDSETVLHFVPLASALNILSSQTLWMMPIGTASNDYMESNLQHPSFHYSSEEIDLDDYAAQLSNNVAFSEFHRRHVFMKCFVAETDSINPTWEDIPDRSTIFNAPMWSHYADQGRGVAIRFNREKLEQAFQERTKELKTFHGSVTYVGSGLANMKAPNLVVPDQKHLYSFGEMARYHAENVGRIHFTKHQDWSYENEYRLVAIGDGGDKIVIPIAAAFLGLVFGPHCLLSATERLLVSLARQANHSATISGVWAQWEPELKDEHFESGVYVPPPATYRLSESPASATSDPAMQGSSRAKLHDAAIVQIIRELGEYASKFHYSFSTSHTRSRGTELQWQHRRVVEIGSLDASGRFDFLQSLADDGGSLIVSYLFEVQSNPFRMREPDSTKSPPIPSRIGFKRVSSQEDDWSLLSFLNELRDDLTAILQQGAPVSVPLALDIPWGPKSGTALDGYLESIKNAMPPGYL